MARAIWTGTISFGLVNVPVRLYSAVEQKDIRFHEFEKKSGKRIRHKRVTDGRSSREVDYEDVAKGYEVSDGKYIVLTREELEAADPKKTRTIDIEDFVDLEEIDPIYFEKTYYLGPDKSDGAKRAYKLLAEALGKEHKVGVAKFVMRSKEYLATIRAHDGILVLHTMLFPDEIRNPKKTIEALPGATKIAARDLDMARRLIDGLATEFDPHKYKDTHRQRVLDLIRKKGKGQEITVEKAEETEAPVDLMEALRASVEAIQKKQTSKKGRKAG